MPDEEIYDPLDDVEPDPELERIIFNKEAVSDHLMPHVEAALEWWVKKLSPEIKHKESEGITRHYRYEFGSWQSLSFVMQSGHIPKEKIEAFKQRWRDIVPDYLTRGGWDSAIESGNTKLHEEARLIYCHNGPDGVLRMIAEDAKIDLRYFPAHIVMFVNPDGVWVNSEEYGYLPKQVWSPK